MRPDAFELMEQEEERHWWFRARREIIDRMLAKLALPADAKLLDAGCGSGGNLNLLSRYGRVYAFETDEGAVGHARARAVATVASGALPNHVPFPTERFDAIGLFDVLEHLEDPVGSLRVLRNRLTSGGSILITVPAYQWLWGPHDETHQHFRRYSTRLLGSQLREAGFRVDYISHTNLLLLPLAVLQRLRERFLGYSASNLRVGDLVNSMFYWMWSAEKYLLPRTTLAFGLSVIAIASISNEQTA